MLSFNEMCSFLSSNLPHIVYCICMCLSSLCVGQRTCYYNGKATFWIFLFLSFVFFLNLIKTAALSCVFKLVHVTNKFGESNKEIERKWERYCKIFIALVKYLAGFSFKMYINFKCHYKERSCWIHCKAIALVWNNPIINGLILFSVPEYRPNRILVSDF